MVEPAHPFEGSELQRFDSFSGRPAVNQLRLIQIVDGFGQSVIVALALAADRGGDPGFGQSLGVADGEVLRPAIRMMNSACIPLTLASVERLLQGIQNKVGKH